MKMLMVMMRVFVKNQWRTNLANFVPRTYSSHSLAAYHCHPDDDDHCDDDHDHYDDDDDDDDECDDDDDEYDDYEGGDDADADTDVAHPSFTALWLNTHMLMMRMMMMMMRFIMKLMMRLTAHRLLVRNNSFCLSK